MLIDKWIEGGVRMLLQTTLSPSELLFHILTSVEFTLITGVVIYIVYRQVNLERFIKDKVFNNTYKELVEILQKRLRDINSSTNAEIALTTYFREKIKNVYSTYKQVKEGGLSKLRDDQFTATFLSDGRLWLERFYDYYPEEFLSKISEINKSTYNEFVLALQLDISTTHSDDHLDLLKSHTIGFVDKNIHNIVKLFNSTKHLIKDEDFLNKYPELKHKDTVVIEENVTTQYLKFGNVLQLRTDEIILLIKSGTSGIEEAIHLLDVFTHKKPELNKILILISSRFRDYINKDISGLSPEVGELNKIKSDLVEVIEMLKKQQ